MSSGHHDHEHLYVEGDSVVHRLPPPVKVAGAVGFLLVVVLIPRGSWELLAVAAAGVLGLVVAARLPLRTVMSRLAIELPFLGFALLMPLFGSGRQVQVLGITLYVEGIEAGATLLVKGTLGVVVAVVLAATTTVPDILVGLRRLHVPAALVLVMQLMLTYLGVVIDDARRMQRARQARGYEPRWLSQAGAFAAGLGALFVRSYERGERVHRAMLARGFNGELP
jgi:cobalt/nickel transport system permease protein